MTSFTTSNASSAKCSVRDDSQPFPPSTFASKSNCGSISCSRCLPIFAWNRPRDFASPLLRYTLQ